MLSLLPLVKREKNKENLKSVWFCSSARRRRLGPPYRAQPYESLVSYLSVISCGLAGTAVTRLIQSQI